MDLTFGKFRIKLELVIIFVLLWIIMSGHLMCSCSRVKPYEAFTEMITPQKKKEGFTSSSGMNNGETFSRFPEKLIDVNSWKQSNAGVYGSSDYNKMNSYKTPNPPGKGGNLDYLSGAVFKRECCAYGGGASYSNSSGCACLNTEASKFLITRGGNAAPFIQGSSF
jgi:hypothetical protein